VNFAGPFGLNFVARAIVLPVGILAAVAAYVHASSETLLSPAGATSMRSSLTGHALTKLVDRGFAAAMVDSQTSGEGEFARISDPLLSLARSAFEFDPLEVSTIRTIALGKLLHEDEAKARLAMRLAAKVGKRDSTTNLWLAQDYGRSGDIAALTASFDNMLRTSVRARESAMKPLVELLGREESFGPLGDLLTRRPEWEREFWQEFVGNPVALQNSAEFFKRTGLPIDRLLPDERATLYANLKGLGQFETLHALATLDPAAAEGAKQLAEGRFVSVKRGYPLGWTTHARGSFAAEIHPRSGELQIDARSGSFGLAADRVFRLDRNHRLGIRMAEAVPANAGVQLAAACPGSDGQLLARIVLAPGAMAGETDISAGACEFATLRLSFTAEQGRRDPFIRIASISLRPK
jgi:hypothetical protein